VFDKSSNAAGGVKWMEQHEPRHRDLRRFRAEAAELLKIQVQETRHQDSKGTPKPK
jgi:hypothetical protein